VIVRQRLLYFFLAGAILAPALTLCQEKAQEKEKAKETEEAKPVPPKGEAQEAAPPVGAPVDPRAYVVGPQDILYIRVWREPELSGGVSVGPEGSIMLPLVGQVKAVGLTPHQLGARLVEEFGKFVNRPEVMVYVQAVNSKKIMVSGEVNKPGAFPLLTRITVMEALVAAGGLKEFANKKKIVIIRGDKRLFFNYKEVVQGKNLNQNIALENGDHVVVE